MPEATGVKEEMPYPADSSDDSDILEVEDEKPGESDADEEMMQWALRTLQRTQYLSDSENEDEEKEKCPVPVRSAKKKSASKNQVSWRNVGSVLSLLANPETEESSARRNGSAVPVLVAASPPAVPSASPSDPSAAFSPSAAEQSPEDPIACEPMERCGGDALLPKTECSATPSPSADIDAFDEPVEDPLGESVSVCPVPVSASPPVVPSVVTIKKEPSLSPSAALQNGEDPVDCSVFESVEWRGGGTDVPKTEHADVDDFFQTVNEEPMEDPLVGLSSHQTENITLPTLAECIITPSGVMSNQFPTTVSCASTTIVRESDCNDGTAGNKMPLSSCQFSSDEVPKSALTEDSEEDRQRKVEALTTKELTCSYMLGEIDWDRFVASVPPPRSPTTWRVRASTPEEKALFHAQERRRFNIPRSAFTYRLHGYESVVGPLRISCVATRGPGSRAVVTDVAVLCTLNLVCDAVARLPNGVGSLGDVIQLLSDSHFVHANLRQGTSFASEVTAMLNFLNWEEKPCLRFSEEENKCVYLHRGTSEEEIESLYSQQPSAPQASKSCNTEDLEGYHASESLIPCDRRPARPHQGNAPEKWMPTSICGDQPDCVELNGAKKRHIGRKLPDLANSDGSALIRAIRGKMSSITTLANGVLTLASLSSRTTVDSSSSLVNDRLLSSSSPSSSVTLSTAGNALIPVPVAESPPDNSSAVTTTDDPIFSPSAEQNAEDPMEEWRGSDNVPKTECSTTRPARADIDAFNGPIDDSVKEGASGCSLRVAASPPLTPSAVAIKKETPFSPLMAVHNTEDPVEESASVCPVPVATSPPVAIKEEPPLSPSAALKNSEDPMEDSTFDGDTFRPRTECTSPPPRPDIAAFFETVSEESIEDSQEGFAPLHEETVRHPATAESIMTPSGVVHSNQMTRTEFSESSTINTENDSSNDEVVLYNGQFSPCKLQEMSKTPPPHGDSRGSFQEEDIELSIEELTSSEDESEDEWDKFVASVPPPLFKPTWKVRASTPQEKTLFRMQERRRFNNRNRAFTYWLHGYASVVGPVKPSSVAAGCPYSSVLAITGAGVPSSQNLVCDAVARLPSGVGTVEDVTELLSDSQFVSTSLPQGRSLASIVRAVLSFLNSEENTCLRFNAKYNECVYLHRGMSEEELERLYLQQQKASQASRSMRLFYVKHARSLLTPGGPAVCSPPGHAQPGLSSPGKGMRPSNSGQQLAHSAEERHVPKKLQIAANSAESAEVAVPAASEKQPSTGAAAVGVAALVSSSSRITLTNSISSLPSSSSSEKQQEKSGVKIVGGNMLVNAQSALQTLPVSQCMQKNLSSRLVKSPTRRNVSLVPVLVAASPSVSSFASPSDPPSGTIKDTFSLSAAAQGAKSSIACEPMEQCGGDTVLPHTKCSTTSAPHADIDAFDELINDRLEKSVSVSPVPVAASPFVAPSAITTEEKPPLSPSAGGQNAEDDLDDSGFEPRDCLGGDPVVPKTVSSTTPPPCADMDAFSRSAFDEPTKDLLELASLLTEPIALPTMAQCMITPSGVLCDSTAVKAESNREGCTLDNTITLSSGEFSSVTSEEVSRSPLSGDEEEDLPKKDEASRAKKLPCSGDVSEDDWDKFVASVPPPRFPTTWKVRASTPQERARFRAQERQRFSNHKRAFTYWLHDYESVVGPVNHSSIGYHHLVCDAVARLPNGVGSLEDVIQLLSDSQFVYVRPRQRTILASKITAMLNFLSSRVEPCLHFSEKHNKCVYLYRGMSEEDLESLYQQHSNASEVSNTMGHQEPEGDCKAESLIICDGPLAHPVQGNAQPTLPSPGKQMHSSTSGPQPVVIDLTDTENTGFSEKFQIGASSDESALIAKALTQGGNSSARVPVNGVVSSVSSSSNTIVTNRTPSSSSTVSSPVTTSANSELLSLMSQAFSTCDGPPACLSQAIGTLTLPSSRKRMRKQIFVPNNVSHVSLRGGANTPFSCILRNPSTMSVSPSVTSSSNEALLSPPSSLAFTSGTLLPAPSLTASANGVLSLSSSPNGMQPLFPSSTMSSSLPLTTMANSGLLSSPLLTVSTSGSLPAHPPQEYAQPVLASVVKETHSSDSDMLTVCIDPNGTEHTEFPINVEVAASCDGSATVEITATCGNESSTTFPENRVLSSVSSSSRTTVTNRMPSSTSTFSSPVTTSANSEQLSSLLSTFCSCDDPAACHSLEHSQPILPCPRKQTHSSNCSPQQVHIDPDITELRCYPRKRQVTPNSVGSAVPIPAACGRESSAAAPVNAVVSSVSSSFRTTATSRTPSLSPTVSSPVTTLANSVLQSSPLSTLTADGVPLAHTSLEYARPILPYPGKRINHSNSNPKLVCVEPKGAEEGFIPTKLQVVESSDQSAVVIIPAAFEEKPLTTATGNPVATLASSISSSSFSSSRSSTPSSSSRVTWTYRNPLLPSTVSPIVLKKRKKRKLTTWASGMVSTSSLTNGVLPSPSSETMRLTNGNLLLTKQAKPANLLSSRVAEAASVIQQEVQAVRKTFLERRSGLQTPRVFVPAQELSSSAWGNEVPSSPCLSMSSGVVLSSPPLSPSTAADGALSSSSSSPPPPLSSSCVASAVEQEQSEEQQQPEAKIVMENMLQKSKSGLQTLPASPCAQKNLPSGLVKEGVVPSDSRATSSPVSIVVGESTAKDKAASGDSIIVNVGENNSTKDSTVKDMMSNALALAPFGACTMSVPSHHLTSEGICLKCYQLFVTYEKCFKISTEKEKVRITEDCEGDTGVESPSCDTGNKERVQCSVCDTPSIGHVIVKHIVDLWAHKCKFCLRRFMDMGKLNNHEIICTQDLQTSLPCVVCAANYGGGVNAHSRPLLFRMQLMCPMCGQVFTSYFNLGVYWTKTAPKCMKIHIVGFSCIICHAQMRGKKALNAHVKRHGNLCWQEVIDTASSSIDETDDMVFVGKNSGKAAEEVTDIPPSSGDESDDVEIVEENPGKKAVEVPEVVISSDDSDSSEDEDEKPGESAGEVTNLVSSSAERDDPEIVDEMPGESALPSSKDSVAAVGAQSDAPLSVSAVDSTFEDMVVDVDPTMICESFEQEDNKASIDSHLPQDGLGNVIKKMDPVHSFDEKKIKDLPNFVRDLWEMVNDRETDNLIRWSTKGSSFLVCDKRMFAKKLLPLYYRHQTLYTFLYTLFNYGFKRVEEDKEMLIYNELEYGHKCFVKGQPHLLEHIKKGYKPSSKDSAAAVDAQSDAPLSVSAADSTFEDMVVDVDPTMICESFEQEDNKASIDSHLPQDGLGNVIKKMDPVLSSDDEKNIKALPTFVRDLWEMVNDKKTNYLIRWSSKGSSFLICDKRMFAEKLMLLYCRNLYAFLEVLVSYGFKRVEEDKEMLIYNELEYGHKCFVKGQPHLLEHIRKGSESSIVTLDGAAAETDAGQRVTSVKEKSVCAPAMGVPNKPVPPLLKQKKVITYPPARKKKINLENSTLKYTGPSFR